MLDTPIRLHHMIMEYAKVVVAGTSDCVTTSREEAMTQVEYDRNWWRSAIVDACEPQDCWMAWKFPRMDQPKNTWIISTGERVARMFIDVAQSAPPIATNPLPASRRRSTGWRYGERK